MDARAPTGFFQRLAEGAGLRVPTETVQSVVQRLVAHGFRGELDRHLREVCQGLGLNLTGVRLDIEEALACAQTGQPVLLLLARGERVELLSVYGSEEPVARVERLTASENLGFTVPRARIAEDMHLGEARLEAAFCVSTIAGEPDVAPPSYEGRPFLRLWHFLSPDRTEILIVVGFAIGLGVLTLATPIAVQSLVNFVAFGGLMQPLVVVGLLLLFFLAFAGAIRVFKFYVVEILQRRIFVRVVSTLSARLPRVRVDVYDRGYGPELVNRFFDVLTVQKAGSTLLIGGLDVVLQAGIGLIVLGFYHPFLLLLDMVLIAAISFVLLGLGRGGIRSAREESQSKYRVAGALEELARAPVTYKLAGAPEYARARLAELAGDYIGARRKHYGVVMRQMMGAVTLHAVAATALLTLGGYLVIQGQLTLGQLVAAELIVSAVLVSFVKFGKELEAFYDLMAGVDKLGILFDLPVEKDDGEPHMPGDSGAELELRDVSYCFPEFAGGLKRISLHVRPNERVAVRGGRGSGKSTLAELICGLREPERGVVLFDRVDIRDIAKVSIRSQMDLVKGFEIVEGSVLDNIRLGRSGISITQVRDVLARFGILDELLELPDGLRTELTCFGAPLSHTTAQLLVLARAVIDSPRAIVVDGVLDELDPDSLRRSLAVIADRDAPWTLLVFTSRDDVCQAMVPDRVVTIEPARTSVRPAVAAAVCADSQ